MLELRNLSIRLKQNDRPIIKNLNITFNKGDKVAIIGEEGNGKSTLIKAIYDSSLIDDYCHLEGQILKRDTKIGYLEQFLDTKWEDHSVNEYFLKDDPNEEINYDKYSEIPTVSLILSRFKLDPEIVYSDQKISTLSGGEKVKIQLAKIISANPDIILLDEPTNDLDLETLEWLEEFISSSNIPIIYISHDETLLENTANAVIHLEQLKRKSDVRYTFEHIGYKEYVEKRFGLIAKQGQIAKKQRTEYQSQMEKWRQIYQKVDHMQETITRSDPHGGQLLKKKMKSLKSQEARLEKNKEEFLDIPDVEEAIDFKFDSDIYIPNGKNILNLGISRLFNSGRLLSTNIELVVNGPQHLVIIGKNGIGKTTLLRHIYEQLANREDLNVGYMPQNYDDMIDLEQTAVDFIKAGHANDDITKARTFMGNMRFTSDEMISKIRNLSGGQKAKLFILKMVLSKCNVLILDEPTRNLSPLSNPIIRRVLANYNGTIISVSHDRKYIDEVCDIIYELTDNGLFMRDSYRSDYQKHNRK